MKYLVKYKLQREVSVVVDIADEYVNDSFAQLGEIKTDDDFEDDFDPRWKIEEDAYESFSRCDTYEDEGDETIVDREITIFNE